MAIEHEVVKFVAEIDLDPQDKEAFTRALKDSNEQCAALRKTIAETELAMSKLGSAGKKDSEEFKKLGVKLNETKDKLKETSKASNKYASALGINQMTMNQLKGYAKRLKTELNSLHKESDPKVWKKYNNELIATQKRMKELEGGMKDTGGILGLLKSKFGVASAIIGSAISIGSGIAAVYNKIAQETQVMGDKWAITQEMMSAGWKQLIANITSGRNVIKGTIWDAMQAAKEAAILRDELFERENSYKILASQAQEYINAQQAIAQDSSKSAEERMKALDKIKDKELELAGIRQKIALQNEDAALQALEHRTGLDREQLKLIIDQYEVNKVTIDQAKEYNDLLSQRDAIEKEQRKLGLKVTPGFDASAKDDEYRARLRDINQLISETPQMVQDYASFLRQYDLANDNLVKDYVDAAIQLQQVSNDLAAVDATQARRRGALTNQINEEQKKAREDAYKDQIEQAEKSYNEQLLSLKNQLLAKELTEAEYQAKSLTAESVLLQKKRAVNIAYGKDVIDIETKIADQQLKIQAIIDKARDNTDFLKRMREQAKADIEALTDEIERDLAALSSEIENDPDLQPRISVLLEKSKTEPVSTKGRLASLDEEYNSEMSDLQEMYDLKLLSEEEFLARKKELNFRYTKETMQIQLETTEKTLGFMQQFIGAVSEMTSAAKDAELADLDAQMQKELAMAGDNADKRAEIEAKYEAKKLDVQKKYADIDMGVKIAQTLAAGALAVVQALAQLGPIAGGAMAGVITATTALQVASIVAQRNAIKNASAESAPSKPGPETGAVVGFSEGGYTGNGGRLEVAGVVHRGEYVVPQPEMRDPQVAAMVADIEHKRRRHTSSHSLPGYSEGGYADSRAAASEDTAILKEIRGLLYSISGEPIPAYVVLSDLEAKTELRDRFRHRTSLRR